MKTQTLTINGQDYALVIQSRGRFDAAEQREIQRLGELHKVKHFKTQTEAAKFVADLIGCNQNTFWRLPMGERFLK